MQNKIQKQLLTMLFFWLIMFYYETLFHIFTVSKTINITYLYIFLFSISFSQINCILSTLFKSRALTSVFVLLPAVAYLVEYFIFRQFKVFYDISTVTGGAGDAMGSFASNIFRLVFSFDGITKLVLFLLPFILYLVFSKRFLPAVRFNAVGRLISLGTALLSYIVALLIISFTPLAPLNNSEYDFQSAIKNFGLANAVVLDFKNLVLPSDNFENEQNETAVTDTEQTEVETPKQYGFNKIDIDFETLKNNANQTHKELDDYVSSLAATRQNEYTGIFKGKNLIMITAEAFCANVIDPTLTPTLYRLATKGINFTDFYQPSSAGTTGGEYQNIFGMLPTSGGMSFKKTQSNLNYYTMGSQLDRLGYYGVCYHNNTYTYYDRHKTHINLGYSDGFIGYGNGMEQYVKKQWPQSDLEMFTGTLPTYIDKQPFNVYYMTVSGHSDYTKDTNAITKKNFERVNSLPYSTAVKGYLAANLELEDALCYLVGELEARGIADDTVIVIASDHFPYGLDNDAMFGQMDNLSELYGYPVTNYFERDRSALIIWSKCLEQNEPIVVDSPTSSLDILPTLSNLFGTEFDSRLMVGSDVFSDANPLVFNLNYDFKTELGTYYKASDRFIPKDDTTVIPDGYVESVKAIVRDKIRYCKSALNSNYLAHIFKGENNA